MYRNILVPVLLDDDHNPKAQFQAALALADDGAAFTVLNVMEALPGYVATEISPNILAQSRKTTEAALKAVARDLPRATPLVVTGHAGRSIIEHARDNGCDCIVLQSHTPGLKDIFLGSTAAHVTRHARCSVHVIR